MKIAFIVGKTSDIYPTKITSKKAPDWLRHGIGPYKDFVTKDPDDLEYNNTVPSDVAMAVYLKYHHPKDTFDLIDGTEPEKITLSMLNQYDMIFNIYDAIEIRHCGKNKTCPDASTRFESLMQRTRAHVYPYPGFHKYIINKYRYYTDLKKAGIPLADFIKVLPEDAMKKPGVLKKQIIAKNWKGVIFKPSYSGYSLGIKVIKDIKNTSTKTIRNYFKKMHDKGFPNISVQEFIPSFSKNYEIRTYWLNERYAFSVGTLTRSVGTGDGLPIDGFNTFKNEGGTLPDYILVKLKKIAKKVLKTLKSYSDIPHPLIRVDFGCCLGGEKDHYFVNEVESAACNMLANHTNFPVVEKTADVFYKYSKKIINNNKK